MDVLGHSIAGRMPAPAIFILGLLAGLLIATTSPAAVATGAIADEELATAAGSVHHTVDVAELARDDTSPHHAGWAPWIHTESGRPYRLIDTTLLFDVAPEVTEMFPVESIVAGLHRFNDVPGSSVRVDVRVDADTTGADWTVELDECDGRFTDKSGWARPHVSHVDEYGAWVDSGRIGLCVSAEGDSRHFVRALVSHELAHLLGFAHLCDTDECWQFDGHTDPCAFMFPSAHACQSTEHVEGVLASLYPSGPGVIVPSEVTGPAGGDTRPAAEPPAGGDRHLPMGVRR